MQIKFLFLAGLASLAIASPAADKKGHHHNTHTCRHNACYSVVAGKANGIKHCIREMTKTITPNPVIITSFLADITKAPSLPVKRDAEELEDVEDLEERSEQKHKHHHFPYPRACKIAKDFSSACRCNGITASNFTLPALTLTTFLPAPPGGLPGLPGNVPALPTAVPGLPV